MKNAQHPPAAVGSAMPEADLGHGPSRGHNLPVANVLPLAAPVLVVAAYTGIIAAFWLSFAADTSASLSIAVSTAYGIVFFGVPYFMLRTASKHGQGGRRPPLSEFLHGDFDTIYGRLNGRAAFIQVILIPIVLALGSFAIGIIYVTSL